MTSSEIESRISQLLSEYAQTQKSYFSKKGLLKGELSLKGHLSLDSFSLVSILLRLGDELNIDLSQFDLALQKIETVGDVLQLAQKLSQPQRNDRS